MYITSDALLDLDANAVESVGASLIVKGSVAQKESATTEAIVFSALDVYKRQAHVNRYVKKVTIDEQNEKGLSIRIDWILNDIQVPYMMEYLICNNLSLIHI